MSPGTQQMPLAGHAWRREAESGLAHFVRLDGSPAFCGREGEQWGAELDLWGGETTPLCHECQAALFRWWGRRTRPEHREEERDVF